MSDVSGIQLDQLLFAPFKSALDAQILLSFTSLKYISDYGLDSSGNMKIVQINSSYYDVSSSTIKDVSLNIPVVSLINIPCLTMKTLSVDFDINIQSQTINTLDVRPSVISPNYFNTSGLSASSIKTSGYVSSEKSGSYTPKYNIHIEAINEKTLGLLMIYDFINKNRDIIRPATGAGNVSLKSIFG